MYRSILLAASLVLLSTTASLAQTVVKGSVVDSAGLALPGTTMLLINPADSSVVAYGVTDPSGSFALTTHRTGTHWLQARVVGYVVENKTVTLPTSSNLIFTMRIDPKEIDAVRIKGTMRGVKQRGDTLTYDPRAFTSGMEKTLGDILAKLPGLQVSEDGTVSAQGKPVEKVLFGGRDLFGGNVGLATKSVSADVADSVRVIHGYSEYSVLDGFQSHDKTVIDVGVSESMWNKLSGEVRAAAGYKNVYDAKVQTMFLGKKIMVNLQTLANNTGAPLFSYSDYLAMQGGAERIDGGYSISIRTDDALFKLINPPSDTYKKRAELAMLHMSYNPDKRFKLNFGTVGTELLSHARSSTERVFNTGPWAGKQRIAILEGTDRTGLILGMLTASYSPSDKTTLQYSIKTDYTKANAASSALERFEDDTITDDSQSEKRPLNLSTALSGAFRLGSHLLTLSAAYDCSRTRSDASFVSDSLTLPLLLARSDGRYFVEQQNSSMRQVVNLGTSIKFRLTASQFLSLRGANVLTLSRLNLLTNPQPSLLPGGALFNDPWDSQNRLSQNDLSLALAWIRNEGLLRFTIGLEAHYYRSWHNLPADLNGMRNFALIPNVELKLHFDSMHELTLNYEETIAPNPLSSFVPGYVFQSLLSMSQRGFASRLYNHVRSASLSYMLFHTPSSLFLDASVASSWINGLDLVYDSYGIAAIVHPIDGSTSRSTSAHLFVDKTIASFWKFSGGATWRNNDSYYYVASDKLPYQQHAVSANTSLRTTYKTVVNGNVSGRIATTYYRMGVNAPWRHTLEWEATAGIDLKYKAFSASVKSGYSVAPGNFIASRSTLLNVELAYDFPHGITLSAIGENLVNMSLDSYSSERLSALYIERRLYGTIPGYALLQLRWKFGGKSNDDGFGMNVTTY